MVTTVLIFVVKQPLQPLVVGEKVNIFWPYDFVFRDIGKCRKREEAVAEAQAQFSAIGNPLFSFPLDVPSIEATSIFDRGDSPRDLQEPCKTTQV